MISPVPKSRVEVPFSRMQEVEPRTDRSKERDEKFCFE